MTRRGRPPKTGTAEIIAATLEVIRDRGIARLTTREIASRMGISEGSIFYHFGDRRGLVKAVFDEALRPLWEYRTLSLTPPATIDDVRAGLGTFTGSVSEFLDAGLDVLLSAQADADLRADVFAVMAENDYGPQRGVEAATAYLDDAQRRGITCADADNRALAYILISTVFLRMSQPRVVGHARGTVDAEQILDTVMRALIPS